MLTHLGYLVWSEADCETSTMAYQTLPNHTFADEQIILLQVGTLAERSLIPLIGHIVSDLRLSLAWSCDHTLATVRSRRQRGSIHMA